MYDSGIGGGGFALIRRPNKTYEMVDFREKAPAAAFKHMFDGYKYGSQIGGNARYVLKRDTETNSELIVLTVGSPVSYVAWNIYTTRTAAKS